MLTRNEQRMLERLGRMMQSIPAGEPGGENNKEDTMDAGQTTSYIDDNGQKKTGVIAPRYNKNTDYTQNMMRAAADGDMGAAAYYEGQYNKKIAGEGLGYGPSNLYAQYAKPYTQEEMAKLEGGYRPSYNKDTDYTAQMLKAAANGDMGAAAYYEGQYNKKIAGEGLKQYQQSHLYRDYVTAYDDAQRAELERGYRTAAEKAQETGYLESALNMLQEQLKQQLAANETESAKQTELAMLKLQQQKEEAKKKYDNDNVEYDAVGGYESYVNYMANVLYHTDDIMKLREMSKYFRGKYARDGISDRIAQAREMHNACRAALAAKFAVDP